GEIAHLVIDSTGLKVDKAFTPHPAIGARCLMRRLRVLSCLQPLPNVGRIRHLRRIRQSVHDA
ncbi:hypothetical protein O5286_29165, partial [Escherichia coli]|nr:hypothetical protein [Escherichia coli]